MELTIFEKHGQLYADSREVAEMVEKRHDHLLRDIDKYIAVLEKANAPKIGAVKATTPILDSAIYFAAREYIDEKGETRRCFDCTKMGCEMIAHKLTGDKGILFTAAYINRFHEMERTLMERQSPQWQQARLEGKKTRRMETEAIKAFVAYATAAGSKNADKYYIHFTKLADKAVGIADRDAASTAKLLDLRVVEMIIEKAVLAEMTAGTEYHQAFHNVRDRMRQISVLAFMPVPVLVSRAS